MRPQRGFTLVELLAVMAIIGILAGVVAGSVAGLGASGQNAQIQSDTKTLETAADRFFNDSFPQTYPVSNPDTNNDGNLDDLDSPPLPAGDVNVRLIDFDARLPQDPTKTFTPDFIKDIPNSAALVSYRVVTTTGDVFPAADGAALILPSKSRLDVTVADKSTGIPSAVTFDLTMNKNRAAVEVLKTQIPAGYIIGGQSLAAGIEVGNLDIFFGVDNPWKPGHVLKVTAPVLATGRANKWEVKPDYSSARSQSDTTILVDTVRGVIQADGITRDPGPILTHTLEISPATTETPGTLTLEMDRKGPEAGPFPADVPHNESKVTWVLKIFSHPDETSSNDALITNPTLAAVYRWTSQEHSTIQVEDVFEPVAGKQAVLIKGDAVVDPIPVFDSTSPTVLLVTPAINATGVAVGTDIVVTFSEAVDSSTVLVATFKVEEYVFIGGGVGESNPVAGVVTVAGDGLSATLDPDADLANNTDYTVILTSGITDLAGNPLVPFTSTFTTEPPDATSPTVDSVSPVDNATGVAVGTDIVVTFSEAVDSSTVLVATFKVEEYVFIGGGVGESNPVAGVVTVAGDGLSATLDPDADLANNTDYTVILTSGITDLAGNPLVPFTSTFITAEVPLVAGLIGWWPGDGDANDIIGSHNGTPVGGATFAAGLVGDAFSFDGSTGYVDLGTTVAQGVTALTYEAWVNPDDVSGVHGLVVGRILANQMFLSDGGVLFAFRWSATGGSKFVNSFASTATITKIPIGTWTHVAATFDATAIKIYINGVEAASAAFAFPLLDSIHPMLIGTDTNNDRWFDGLIDEVSIYDRTLSASEIQAIFDAGSDGKAK